MAKGNLFPAKRPSEWEPCYRVAVPEWIPDDGIAWMIEHELRALGHEPVKIPHQGPLPQGTDILLTFAPYDKVLPLWEQAAGQEKSRRPTVIHWNTEGLPDLRIPLPAIRAVGALRSKLGRMGSSASALERFLVRFPLLRWADQEMIRFRHYGDYEYAYRKGWLHLLFDSSQIYCRIRTKSGLPTGYAPWGSTRLFYQDLGLERDIDVLWMGARGTRRRSRILNFVKRELAERGVRVHIADNRENPFIFGDLRTEYLNRSKIILNITRTWYDDNFSRFTMAAPNRAMIVSEPVLPHCPEFIENVHYVAAQVKDLPETILYYLHHEAERQQVVENAYRLATVQLPFARSLQRMLEAAGQVRMSQAG